MIEAGSETTSASLNTAILLLGAHPNIQKIARAELDRVVGSQRLPTFADEDALPYIRAMVKEVLRMRPVTTIGSPHYTTKALEYNGYYIPVNTVVTINQYPMHYDSRLGDPEAFRPDRYLGHDEKAGASAANQDPYARDHFSFGAGRRICPGLHLAENSLFITLAMILWAFDVRPPLDAQGREEVVDWSDEAYELGTNTIPKPYRMRLLPVSEERAALVKREWERLSKTAEAQNVG